MRGKIVIFQLYSPVSEDERCKRSDFSRQEGASGPRSSLSVCTFVVVTLPAFPSIPLLSISTSDYNGGITILPLVSSMLGLGLDRRGSPMALSARPIRYIGSSLPTPSNATAGRRPLTPRTTTQVRPL